MTGAEVAPVPWQRLRSFIAQSLGLDFNREAHLRRLFRTVAADLGFSEEAACADWLLSTPPTPAVVQVLARNLTVGETYFFRDRAALDALERDVLPALLHERRGGSRHLRVWCAACCTGEEPYTLAILLHRLLPDPAGWDVSITGTDINAEAIGKAEAGIYGEWSFRNVPLPVRARYFQPAGAGRHRIAPEIRRMVKFGVANLVTAPGAPPPGPAGMDLVLCRNVLMYFGAKCIDQVARHLSACLVPGGHLVVGPGETPSIVRPDLAPVHHPGAVLFRKLDPARAARPAAVARQPVEAPAVAPTAPTAEAVPVAAVVAPAAVHAAHAAQLPSTAAEAGPSADVSAEARQARELADSGRLDEALACCDRRLGIDKLDAAAHYTRAMVLLEQGRPDESRLALQRTLYVQGDVVMAHVALGQLAAGRADPAAARRHFAAAERLLRRCDPSHVVPHGDNLTCGQLLRTLPLLAAARAVA